MFVAAQVFVTRYHHAGLVHPWIGVLFWVFLAGLIGLAVWLFVHETHTVRVEPVAGPSSDPAMSMLRARFAQGEIDAHEFAARAAYLSGQPVPAAPDDSPEKPEPDAPTV